MPFVLYENKAKQLDLKNLGQYNIETEAAHTGLFPFRTIPSGDLLASLRKVDAGRIDGFIFAGVDIDPIVAQGNYKNVHRQLYGYFDGVFLLPKWTKGDEKDKLLTAAITKANQDPSVKAIIARALATYKGVDWQP